MSYLSESTQRRGNQPMYPHVIQGHFHSGMYTLLPALYLALPLVHHLESLAASCIADRPCLYEPVINLFACIVLPTVPAADEQRDLTEGSETTQTYQPLWVASLSYYAGVPPGTVDSPIGFPFGVRTQTFHERRSLYFQVLSHPISHSI